MSSKITNIQPDSLAEIQPNSLQSHELLNSASELATNINNHSGRDDDNDRDKWCYSGTCIVTLKERESDPRTYWPASKWLAN